MDTSEDIRQLQNAIEARNFAELAKLRREYMKRSRDNRQVAELFKAILAKNTEAHESDGI